MKDLVPGTYDLFDLLDAQNAEEQSHRDAAVPATPARHVRPELGPILRYAMSGDPEAQNMAQMEDSRRQGRLALADLLRELGRHDRADEVVRRRPGGGQYDFAHAPESLPNLVAEATLEQAAESIQSSVDRLAGVVARQSPPGLTTTRTVERDADGLVKQIVEEKSDGALILKRFERGPDGLITRVIEEPIS